MSFSWIRPADPAVLEGRPLLDLGTGEGQTLAALTRPDGLLVGVDRSFEALRVARQRARVVCADARNLPFNDSSFAVVLAGDLFHHLADSELRGVLGEVRAALAPGGSLVAWWYESPGRAAPDAPRYPRSFAEVAEWASAFARIEPLPLVATLEPAPPTAGLVAYAGS